jgi:hypothetical protein
MTAFKEQPNFDTIAAIIRKVNEDGTIDDILSTAPNTTARRVRYLEICFLIDRVLRVAEEIPSV